MRKVLILSLIMGIYLSFTSCGDDDDAPILGANVKVTVTNIAGVKQENVEVYMFKDLKPDESTDPGSASKKEVTNADGIAYFKLNLLEMNIIESKTNLYFAVYYRVGGDLILKVGDASVTVKRDDEKAITLTIPI